MQEGKLDLRFSCVNGSYGSNIEQMGVITLALLSIPNTCIPALQSTNERNFLLSNSSQLSVLRYKGGRTILTIEGGDLRTACRRRTCGLNAHVVFAFLLFLVKTVTWDKVYPGS